MIKQKPFKVTQYFCIAVFRINFKRFQSRCLQIFLIVFFIFFIIIYQTFADYFLLTLLISQNLQKNQEIKIIIFKLLMFSLFILFFVQIIAQDLSPSSQCLGNCLSCVSGEPAVCSNNNNITCQEGFYFNQNMSACLINPNFNSSYASQQLQQQNNKNLLIAPVGWTQSATTQCLYLDDNGNQQHFNILGPFKQILSTYKYFDVNPQHSVYLISFNLIRNQWLPFNDFMVIDVQSNKKLLNSLQISYDQNPNAVSSMSIFCGGKSVITQKFTIKIINKTPVSQIKVTFTGFLFNSIWGLTNIKFTPGCNDFSVFNQKTQNCDNCDQGYYSLIDNNNIMTCTKCPYQCLTCSSSNVCTSCISGYVFASVTKNCGKDQGINQLPFVNSFVNSTTSTCTNGNLSYISIPFNGSLTSSTYTSQNNLNLGNISIVFQFYYNPQAWINSTNVAQIYANGVFFANLTNLNLTNKGAIQCSGKNSTMAMIKFSTSSSYQFNTSNIVLTFSISGSQNISYGINNVGIFSTPNYNNVKLYTRDQLIQMMNSSSQSIKSSNTQQISNNNSVNLSAISNSNTTISISISNNNTLNLSIAGTSNSSTSSISNNNPSNPSAINNSDNSSPVSISSSNAANISITNNINSTTFSNNTINGTATILSNNSANATVITSNNLIVSASSNNTVNIPSINNNTVTVLVYNNITNISTPLTINSTAQSLPNNSTINSSIPSFSENSTIFLTSNQTKINITVDNSKSQNLSATNSSNDNSNQILASITSNINFHNISTSTNSQGTPIIKNSPSSFFVNQSISLISSNSNTNSTQNSKIILANSTQNESLMTNAIPMINKSQQVSSQTNIIKNDSILYSINQTTSAENASSSIQNNAKQNMTQTDSKSNNTLLAQNNISSNTNDASITSGSVDILNQTQNSHSKINQTISQNSTIITNQSNSKTNLNITKNLSIPNNTITVQYVQFAQNGNSGIKIKISNASLYSGYNLYASVLKFSSNSRTNLNQLFNGEVIDDHFIGFLNINESFKDSQVQIFGISDNKINNITSINQTISTRLLQQQVTIQFSNIAEFTVDRYDLIQPSNQQSIESISNSFAFFVWFTIIGIILLSFIGKSVILEDFVISLQILFLNAYLFTYSLPNSIINSFYGLQRIQKINYFQTNSLNWLENLLFGDLKQDSPIQFTVFDVDINFTRAVLPIIVLNLIFLIWFFVLFFIEKYGKNNQKKLVHNEPSQTLKQIQKITNRKMNFVDQIWKYQFIPVVWACLKQFHNFQYPQNDQNGQIFNTLFCLIAFIGILVWPVVVIIYTRSIYYQRQYIEYFQSFKQIFYQRVPQDHLPSIHQRVIYPIFKTVKLLIYVMFLSIFIDFPLVTLITMFLIVSFELFYLYSYKIYENKFCLWFKYIQCLIHSLLWAFLIIIWSLSSTVQSDGYLAMGYVFVALSFSIILNGGAQSGYLGWKQFGKYFKIKSEQEQEFNVEQPQQILRSYRVV